MSTEAAAHPVLDRLLQLGETGVPVLRATVVELTRLEGVQDRISSNDLANAVLRDPLMTLRVLCYLYRHRTRSQTQDITTIAHALLMLGMARFFREFSGLPVIEDCLATAPDAAIAARAAASRARLASLFARDWAVQRHDMDPEQVMVAALVHDVVELLLLCEWPEAAPQFSLAAQSELRAALFARLGLPGLLSELTLDADGAHPRVLNVSLACSLARRCAQGWNDPAIEDELARVQRFLHISPLEVWERIRKVVLLAAREWQFYQTLPAAAYLPMQAPLRATVDPSNRKMS